MTVDFTSPLPPKGISDPLTPGQVAGLFNVDSKTVARWRDQGRIKDERTPGGHSRYRWAELRRVYAAAQRRHKSRSMTNRTPASATLKIGAGSGYALHFTAEPAKDNNPGSTTIIIGYTPGGKPVTLTVTSIGWLDDLESAIQAARAAGIVQGDMQPVPA